ncbi:QacE family quaternary ammonium compound efflux SMR transporter [Glycomyces sp. TRM65418]|uniref:DMT family transporter n=1 Tax=Glycomyces sp. TRM65418 TaxID=2867006 RepID=UPI001CE5FD9A|nr:SMR family transporter [Glycomyces sp. TRM65418]MCC3764334.1 QacE family quaternary ammonium compound efflux SMR transporter [Glycomyces sp. TRM65418]QZD54013.1 QacE family quaternary ammonium compound efflux SMR transporter [Glycomyces sp. TRM65418]
MAWVFLAVAILSEVTAALSLRAATGGRNAWYVLVAVGYTVALTALTLVLDLGMGIGVAYGVWAASGVALTAVASKYLFKEPFTKVMAAGIAMVAAGVLLVELGAGH